MTLVHLKPAKLELSAAERALNSMKSASSMDEFEGEWRNYLNAIEKVWNKTERCCQHVRNTFQPWQGKYSQLRRKDMLLRYLKQARDADNHSIQEITALQPGSRNLRFVNPNGGYIKHLRIHDGQFLEYEGDPMVIEDVPPHPVAVPVKNNGEWYNPPTTHLGNPVANLHPVFLAELGIKFYTDFVKAAEETFFVVKT